MRIFDEFDRDRDGHLCAKELSAALRSRRVDISEEQVQQFIDGELQTCPPARAPAGRRALEAGAQVCSAQ